MIRKLEQIRALREAGDVMRCHTFRHHGEYNVAYHSWQACMLLLSLHPDPSLNLVQAVLFHDVAERYFGDVPAPAKREDDLLTAAHLDAERRTMKFLNVDFHLNEEERHWLDCVDKLEIYLWCKDQKALGNENVDNALRLTQIWFTNRWEQLPETIQDFINEYKWQRGSDVPPR